MSSAVAGIEGSSHDLSTESWSDGEICSPCHTPHNANGAAGGPLWNHDETTATFTTYSTSTMDEPTGQPGDTSLLCLGCHDGTVALDSFGGATGTTTISGVALLSTDLSDDHPIAMDYAHQVGWGVPPCSNCHLSHSPATNPGPVYFPGGQVTCVSCHDPHDKEDTAGMLVMDNATSELCLWCHGK